jgi:integrase
LLLDTGARHSEIANLAWDQIDLEAGTLRIWRSKVENEGVLFMTARVKTVIANRLSWRRGKFLFQNSVGDARGYRVAALRAAFDRAGLHDCSLHTLRHTHATRLIQNGMTLYEVRVILGHSDIRTTMRYAHLEQADVTSRARNLIDGLNKATII